MQTDRQKIKDAAERAGWDSEDDGPYTIVFWKGRRSLTVHFQHDKPDVPASAFSGMKRLWSSRLTAEIIGTLKKS